MLKTLRTYFQNRICDDTRNNFNDIYLRSSIQIEHCMERNHSRLNELYNAHCFFYCLMLRSCMRILVLLLVFAIGYNGFSTAVHAFDWQKCDQSALIEKNKSSTTSLDFNANKDESKNTPDTEATCLACGQCCAFHAYIPQSGLIVNVPASASSFAIVHHYISGDILSGFKRPPRILV